MTPRTFWKGRVSCVRDSCFFVLAFVLLLGAASPALAADLSAFAQAGDLHTNDVHGRAGGERGGGHLRYAALAELKEELEAAGASVLLLERATPRRHALVNRARARRPSSS